MELNNMIASLASYFCFYDDDCLSLVGTDSDFTAISGYSPLEFESKFQNEMLGLIIPDDRSNFYKELRAQLAAKNLAELIFRIRHKNGRLVWALAKIQKVTEESSGDEYYCGIMMDCTQYKKQQDNADNLMHQYQIILSQTQNVTFELDIPNDTITFSDTWNTLFHYTPGTKNFIATLPAKAHIHPEDIPRLLHCLRAMRKGESYKTLDIRISTGSSDAAFTWFCLRATAMYDDDNRLLKIIGIVLDIDEKKRAAEKLKDKAECDFLTKLYNKATCQRLIKEYLSSIPDGAHCAMIMIDLDDFKHINDNYGHQFGDKVLLKASEAIRSSFRENDILARVGGDEFMVLMKHISTPKVIEDRCQRMLETFHTLLTEDGVEDVTGFSIGIALSPHHATTYDDLFKCADEAMYETKKNGKNRYSIYQKVEPIYYY